MAKKKQADVITLDAPIKRGDTTIKEITINPPQSGAFRGVSLFELMNMKTDCLYKVLPRVTSPALTEQELMTVVDPRDFVQMGIAIVSFLVPSSALTDYPEN